MDITFIYSGDIGNGKEHGNYNLRCCSTPRVMQDFVRAPCFALFKFFKHQSKRIHIPPKCCLLGMFREPCLSMN